MFRDNLCQLRKLNGLSQEELAHIDCALNHMEMSAVFGGAKIIK